MSPATNANPAWLTVPSAEDLPEEVATEIGPVAQKIGFVPNVARLLAISDADILHIVEVTAIFNYNVWLATATGLFPNSGYHELGRAPGREG